MKDAKALLLLKQLSLETNYCSGPPSVQLLAPSYCAPLRRCRPSLCQAAGKVQHTEGTGLAVSVHSKQESVTYSPGVNSQRSDAQSLMKGESALQLKHVE